MKARAFSLACLVALGLCACREDAPQPVLETVAASDIVLSVQAGGELKSSKATPLMVPGQNWSSRRLTWMVPEGSLVKKGELIARFSAEEGAQQLAQAMIDLQRNALARSAKEGELDAGRGRVDVDLAKVGTDLGIAPDDITVLVHPQSVVHSLVEFHDGSQLAQLGTPDMRLAIAACLLWPRCVPVNVPPLDLTAKALTFHEPDESAFPCLGLARQALKNRGGRCVVLNAANEVANLAFREGRISFPRIADVIATTMQKAHFIAAPTLDDLFSTDAHARRLASEML